MTEIREATGLFLDGKKIIFFLSLSLCHLMVKNEVPEKAH